MKETIQNQAWLKQNEAEINNLFPETWTPIKKLNTIKLVLGFKMLGLDLKSDGELMQVMAYFDQIGLLKRFGSKIRRNPESIFKNKKPVNIKKNANVAPSKDIKK